jgi:hypothetical protein
MQALKQWVYRSTMHGLYTQMYCSVLRILYRQKGSISVQWARVKNTKSILLELLPLLGVVSVAHKKMKYCAPLGVFGSFECRISNEEDDSELEMHVAEKF